MNRILKKTWSWALGAFVALSLPLPAQEPAAFNPDKKWKRY